MLSGKWKDAMGLVRVQKYSYFKQFVPNAAIKKMEELAGGVSGGDARPDWAHHSKAPPLEADQRPCVILQVDISGFTRLSDRFQGFGQEGIDMLTTTINRMFGIIIDHVESWSGDIIKFAGDAVIVIWPCTEENMAQMMLQALTCAMELERLHGIFKVHVPDAKTLKFADQLARHFATAVSVDVGAAKNDWLPNVSPLEHIEIKRRLRTISFLKVLSDGDINMLAEKCSLMRYKQGEVIMRQGEPGESMLVIQAGVVAIYIKKTGADDHSNDGMISRHQSLDDIGDEVATREEGEFLGEMSMLTGECRTATVIAHTNCVMINVSAAGLLPLMASKPELKEELTDLMQQRLSGKPFTSGVKLRLHQALACGRMWMAHVGGAHLDHQQGPRREFIVLGKALLDSAQALDEAATGTVVVSRAAWEYVKDTYQGEQTPLGNYKVGALLSGKQTMAIPRINIDGAPMFHIWPILKMYCHEGARDLQDIAPFAADVRKLTVIFIRLDLDLENPTLDTVQLTHKACLVIQNATYLYRGTLRQFLQDDKGCLAICVMGMPPFSPHDNDPVRAVLAGLDIARKLPELGIGVYIGVTSGTAYSGFVGSQTRREMCAMGSIVNMSARLMCKAGKNEIWVDEDTCSAGRLMVKFDTLPPVAVKGRDEPLNVFRALHVRSSGDIRQKVLKLVKKHHDVEFLPPALENYFFGLLSKGVSGCSANFISSVCNNLLENGHIHRNPDGTIVSKQNLLGLDNGQTAMQALARGDFESLSLQIHVQMLIKVVCFLSHKSLFSSSLAKYVYSKTFPSFAMDFDSSMMELLEIGVLEAARADEIEQVVSTTASTCHECHSWTWQTPELQADMHAQHLLYYKGSLSDLKGQSLKAGGDHVAAGSKVKADGKHTMSLGRLSLIREKKAAEASKMNMQSFEKFVREYDGKSKLLKVYKCPIPGLVQSVIKGLLHSYQRVWHHQVAEFYEQNLDLTARSSHLILAYHWSRAADHNQADAVHVEKAAQYLRKSAAAAIEECAFREGIDQLHHACRILDRVPLQNKAAMCKLELLSEIAPHTLMLYGHGSPESMAAYHGLMMLVHDDDKLDDRAMKVLAGISVNLHGRQQFEAGSKIARRIYKAGLKSKQQKQMMVGLACMVEAMFFAGDFEDLFLCLERLHEDYAKVREQGKQQPLVNAVAYGLTAMAYWPPALLITGQAESAHLTANEIITMAEELGHPPTHCLVLCTLCNEYYPLAGEIEACEKAAEQAQAISEQYDLGHCRNLAHRAHQWCTGSREHFEMLRAGVKGHDIRKQARELHSFNGSRSDLSRTDIKGGLGSWKTNAGFIKSDGGGGNLRPFDLYGGRFCNLLGLQVMAMRGEWAAIIEKVNNTLAMLADSTETCSYSEYLRVKIAAGIALAQEQDQHSAANSNASASDPAGKPGYVCRNGSKDVGSETCAGASALEGKAWVHSVQTQLRECVVQCMGNGYVFLALLAAVDWLCFEIDQSLKTARDADSKPDSNTRDTAGNAPPAITSSLLEAVGLAKSALCKMSGGNNLLPVKIAQNLVRRYDGLVPPGDHAMSDLQQHMRPRRKSKAHSLIADRPSDVSPSWSSFTESDMQEINEACGDTNAQVLRHLGGQDSTLAVVQEGPIGDASSTEDRQQAAAQAPAGDAFEGVSGNVSPKVKERKVGDTDGPPEQHAIGSAGPAAQAPQTAMLPAQHKSRGSAGDAFAAHVERAVEAGDRGDETPRRMNDVLKISQGGGTGVRTGSSKDVMAAATSEVCEDEVSAEKLAEIQERERGVERLMTESKVREALVTCDDWQFDAFRLDEVSGGQPMQVVGMHLLREHGLVQSLKLDTSRLAQFLYELEKGMPASNPYHNAIHVADVTQTVHVLLKKGGMARHLSQLQVLACLVAALVHDFEHLGLNNDFLVKTCHERALAHNDRAPNENHHVYAAFRLMHKPECNFCRELSCADMSQMRKIIIEMVLATDMAEHQRVVSLLRSDLPSRLGKQGPSTGKAAPRSQPEAAPAAKGAAPGVDEGTLDEKGVSLMLCGAIKIADLGHSFAQFDVHRRWSQQLEAELFAQGDEELKRGLPISYLMDRKKPGVTKSQKGFFEYVVGPLVAAWTESFPASRTLLDQMQVNSARWLALEDRPA